MFWTRRRLKRDQSIMRVSAFVLTAAVAACAHPGEHPLTISIQGLACADCGKELEAIALAQKGVRSAVFDPKHAELNLATGPEADEAAIVRAIEAKPIDGASITAVPRAGQGSYAAFDPLDPDWDAQVLSSSGEDVASLKERATLGKVTVVDFYADWCGPCHDVDRHMHALLARDKALAYRRINIVSWETPVAKHYLKRVDALPFVVVLDAAGEEVERISGLDLEAVDRAIEKGRARAR